MYLAMVLLLMIVLPVGSIAVDWLAGPAHLVPLIGKWFVFWAVGMRLAAAGIKQVADPAFTASRIFGIADPASHVIVRELGFGNLSIGLLGLLTLLLPTWIEPAALAGGVFYGLAGAQHLVQGRRNTKEMSRCLPTFSLSWCWPVTSWPCSSPENARMPFADTDYILYDGECPACRSYMAVAGLRKVRPDLRIIDARKAPDMVAMLRRQGYEINEGMMVSVGGQLFFGADATRLIAQLGKAGGPLRAALLWAIGNAPWSLWLYPRLNWCRRLLLRMLGRKLIA